MTKTEQKNRQNKSRRVSKCPSENTDIKIVKIF